MLKTCSNQLCEIPMYLFNPSLCLWWMSTLWTTSCLIPDPKKKYPKENYEITRITGLWPSPHIFRRLLRNWFSRPHITIRVSMYMNCLQFAYQHTSVDDALILMLYRANAYLDTSDTSVRCAPNMWATSVGPHKTHSSRWRRWECSQSCTLLKKNESCPLHALCHKLPSRFHQGAELSDKCTLIWLFYKQVQYCIFNTMHVHVS